jgi:hypothetical protein
VAYSGSGVEWTSHLKTFGKKIKTEVLIKTNDWDELAYWGKYYSELWRVTTSVDDFGNKIWANILSESGGRKQDVDEEFSCGPTINLRPICKICNKNPRAAAYYRNGKRYYRSACESCRRRGRKLLPATPRWQSSGYQKKSQCDLCGFKAKYSSQLTVHHVDGNLNNSSLINLRTVCLNCVEVVKRTKTTWRPGDVSVDP